MLFFDGPYLKYSEYESCGASSEQEVEPPPEYEEDLVVYHVKSKDADGVDIFLSAGRSPPPVVTGCCK